MSGKSILSARMLAAGKTVAVCTSAGWTLRRQHKKRVDRDNAGSP